MFLNLWLQINLPIKFRIITTDHLLPFLIWVVPQLARLIFENRGLSWVIFGYENVKMDAITFSRVSSFHSAASSLFHPGLRPRLRSLVLPARSAHPLCCHLGSRNRKWAIYPLWRQRRQGSSRGHPIGRMMGGRPWISGWCLQFDGELDNMISWGFIRIILYFSLSALRVET